MVKKCGLSLLLLASLAASGCQRNAAVPVDQMLPTITTKSGIEMVVIPAGCFEMGSRGGRDDERPVHKVWVDAFCMDRTEVTQGEYEKLGQQEAFSNPAHFKGADLPVEQVTWPQAARFCNARSRAEGLTAC